MPTTPLSPLNAARRAVLSRRVRPRSGLDSVIEVASVAWQFAGRDPEARERTALKIIAWSLFALAGYVTVESVRSLTGAAPAEHSTVGIVLAGDTGAGKSTLARALATRLDAVVLDKDRIRAGLFPPSHVDYTPDQNDFCIDVMYRTAAWLLRHAPDSAVILDGCTYTRANQIATLRQHCQPARGDRRTCP